MNAPLDTDRPTTTECQPDAEDPEASIVDDARQMRSGRQGRGGHVMRRLAGMAVALALGVILVAGCGGGASPSPTGSAFPTGTWTASLPNSGTGVVEFRSDGTWSYTLAGEQTSTGTYSTDKDTFTWLTDSFCQEQNAEQGTYTWTYANGQLTFKKQNDECRVGRVTTFDGRAWTQAK
jgi:hypothetical protein